MQNMELLAKFNKNNQESKIIFGKGFYVYKHKGTHFYLKSIKSIIDYLCNINKNTKCNLPIKIIIRDTNTNDKLSLVLFECVCYYIMQKINKRVVVDVKVDRYPHNNILSTSPIQLLTTLKSSNKEQYYKLFKNDISMCHYRTIINGNDTNGTDLLSKEQNNIAIFLKNNSMNEDVRENLADVIVELMDNACTHGSTDCLVDIDIAPDVGKENSTDDFYAINVCVINFSAKLFHEDLFIKLNSDECQRNPKGRYKQVLEAYNFHKKFFSETYTENDFYTIAAYQHLVSGRVDKYQNGGTGMTKLIKNLQKQSVVSQCFMISGNRIMKFKKELLEYDDRKWLGFNEEKDFFHHIPDKKLFFRSQFYMPGTGYNLYFIFKKEAIKNG